MTKETYIELMDRVVSAYTDEHIAEYTAAVRENGILEHGFPRLASNLGALIAHGRRKEYIDRFIDMMELCCDEVPGAMIRNSSKGEVGNDFAVKEMTCCILELEKAGTLPKEITDRWRKKLAVIVPTEAYRAVAPVPPVPMHNWAAFAAVSEQLRKYAGIGGSNDFIDNQFKSQYHAFDVNGMYRDPNNPMVYDMVTRLQFAVALYYGYDGECKDFIEEQLLKSADITLEMQSVTGEIPFGGRSQQFLHNESFYAALCEFYAVFFKKRGDMRRAGMFRSAARLAVSYIEGWLGEDEIHHIKNYYDKDSKYGCEGYGHFNKYMVTCASWLNLALIMSDESIPYVPCPAEGSNGVCVTSADFHRIFMRTGNYTAQIDTNAQPSLDANGIGRLHKHGAPSTICLSVPFSAKPHYNLDMENPGFFSINAALDGEGSADPRVSSYRLTEKTVSSEFTAVKLEITLESGKVITEKVTLANDGLTVEAIGEGEVEIRFPLFDFDGRTHAEIAVGENTAAVSYKGNKCTYTGENMHMREEVFANRHGHYKTAAVRGNGHAVLHIAID